jgi:hypothetical protein
MQQFPTLHEFNETYIYHPFSVRLNGQIHTKMTTTTPQILSSLNLPAAGVERHKQLTDLCNPKQAM